MTQNEDMIISEELIQSYAEEQLERALNAEELEETYYTILEELGMFIRDQIESVIDFQELLKRNEGATTMSVRYDVYWRNPNAYQNDFKKRRSFSNIEDAKTFIHHGCITEYDHWKVICVNDDSEIEVYKVN